MGDRVNGDRVSETCHCERPRVSVSDPKESNRRDYANYQLTDARAEQLAS